MNLNNKYDIFTILEMGKRILFIGSKIFFGTSVGGFRQDRWMKSFLNQSFECHIMDIGMLNPKYLSVNSVKDYQNFREMIKLSTPNTASIRQGKFIDLLRQLKHFFIFDIFNPINLYHFLFVCIKLQKYQFDYIFVSSPSFASVLIGSFLKKKFKNPSLIIDFRDQWANHPFLPKKTIISREKIQNYLLQESDYIITVSNFIKDSINRQNINVIFNAPDINFSKVNITDKRSDKVNFIYTGSLPPNFYNCIGIKELISTLYKKYHYEFIFNFAGACYELEKHKCTENVTFINQLPLNASREMQAEADALLFIAAIGPLNNGIVSSKIFEYIQSGKPILPLFVEENSDVYFIIKESCGWCPCLNSEMQILETFENIKKNGVRIALPSLKNRLFLDNLLESYTTFVKQLQ